MSSLDQIIEPEVIPGDGLFEWLERLAAREDVRTILEIGSSDGRGSTAALVRGIRKNPSSPSLYCMETSKVRFSALQERYKDEPNVFCLNACSVSIGDFLTQQEISDFYFNHPTNLNKYPLTQVFGWLEQDIEYVKKNMIRQRGISVVRSRTEFMPLDMVVLDGSGFTGASELNELYGSKIVVLDDAQKDVKHFHNYRRLVNDPLYKLVWEDAGLRNGAAIFDRT